MTAVNGHKPKIITESIRVALGEKTQAEFAADQGVDAATISRRMAEYYRDAIKHQDKEINRLQGQFNALQSEFNVMQTERNTAQDFASEMQSRFNKLHEEYTALQRDSSSVQSQRNELQAKFTDLQAKYQKAQSELSRWQGQPAIIRRLASTDAKTAMLFLLAAFEGVGSFNLLLPKGIALALPVSVALAFALLVFTASEHKPGKWFCIAFAVVVGAIYFQVAPDWWSKYLFAFVPPAVAALLAFSFKRKL